jgi:hypothetical protein
MYNLYKQIGLLLTVCIVCMASTQAQQVQHAKTINLDSVVNKSALYFRQRLDLNDEQFSRLKSASLRYYLAVMRDRNQHLDTLVQKGTHGGIYNRYQEELKEIFDKRQFDTYQQLMAGRHMEIKRWAGKKALKVKHDPEKND